MGTVVKDLGEWEQIKIPLFSMESMTAQILWHGEDVFVQEPSELKQNVMRELEALVRNHE
jgi:predicted DNA-binding transcriptional regulator YafY